MVFNQLVFQPAQERANPPLLSARCSCHSLPELRAGSCWCSSSLSRRGQGTETAPSPPHGHCVLHAPLWLHLVPSCFCFLFLSDSQQALPRESTTRTVRKAPSQHLHRYRDWIISVLNPCNGLFSPASSCQRRPCPCTKEPLWLQWHSTTMCSHPCGPEGAPGFWGTLPSVPGFPSRWTHHFVSASVKTSSDLIYPAWQLIWIMPWIFNKARPVLINRCFLRKQDFKNQDFKKI